MQTKERSLWFRMFLCSAALLCGYRLMAAEAMHYSKVLAHSSSKVTKAGCDRDENGVYIMLYDHNYCHANVIFQTIKMMNHWKSRSIGRWDSALCCCGNQRLSLRNINLEIAINKWEVPSHPSCWALVTSKKILFQNLPLSAGGWFESGKKLSKHQMVSLRPGLGNTKMMVSSPIWV